MIDLNPTTQIENGCVPNLDGLLEFLTEGYRLGSGDSRTVFQLEGNRVLKVAHAYMDTLTIGIESNLTEKIVWDAVKGTKLEKYFAEVIKCSPCGRYLVMERALPTTHEFFMEEVPSFFRDHRATNMGVVRRYGELIPVAVDYGQVQLLDLNENYTTVPNMAYTKKSQIERTFDNFEHMTSRTQPTLTAPKEVPIEIQPREFEITLSEEGVTKETGLTGLLEPEEETELNRLLDKLNDLKHAQ